MEQEEKTDVILRLFVTATMKRALEQESRRTGAPVAEFVRRCLQQCLERTAKTRKGEIN